MGETGKDQEGRHREVKTTIQDFFPLKKESILDAFKNLDPRNDSSDVKTAEAQEILRLQKTNPYALISFGNLLESYTEAEAAQLRRGNVICHQALWLGANGELPRFTEEFVQAYDDEQDAIARREFNDKYLHPYPRELLKRQSNIARFREFEPEISKIVERKLRARSKSWRPEQDRTYAGFMDLYFLFREGYSDPKNFAEKPS